MRSPLAAASTALALSLVASSATAQTMPPQQDMELARSIFSELIEINTVNSELGNNTTAALVDPGKREPGFQRFLANVAIQWDRSHAGTDSVENQPAVPNDGAVQQFTVMTATAVAGITVEAPPGKRHGQRRQAL